MYKPCGRFTLVSLTMMAITLLVAPHANSNPAEPTAAPAPAETAPAALTPKPVPEFLTRGVAWLAAAQFDNGGWGAGMQAQQNIRDPRAVQMDPATTAFAAMALLRAGNTLTAGPYHQHVSKALQYLLETVEMFPEDGPKITDLSGTQPQAKLGQLIDTSMCVQFFSRALPHIQHDPQLAERVTKALDKT